MATKIILQRLVEVERANSDVPFEWHYRDLKSFGLDWELFEYQQKALEYITTVLRLFYRPDENGLANLYQLYRSNGLDVELDNELAVDEENDNYEFLSKYYQTSGAHIPFERFVNRAAFWMATGCGKTLVMIKLLAVLADLMNKKLIPRKDILILAPKDEILNQIKDHVSKFNKGSEININLRNLKDYERVKNQQSIFSKDEINVFYYRADNIAGKDMVAKKKDGQRLDYESIYNNGNWYLILDEAHKGEKETSKRQQYYLALTHNGFLFNFSATFTDELDIATTVFDYKLDTFLKDGYGKMLYVTDSDFSSFRGDDEDRYSDDDKKNIIIQTLFILAIAKQHHLKLKSVDNRLYHSPLLITLANSVNTEEADLKIFYSLLAEIAAGRFNFNSAKRGLVEKLESNDKYLFDLGELDRGLVPEIRALTEADFRKAVFNTATKGNIEVIKLRNNDRELVFKLVNSPKYFMLIHASDIVKWEQNVLEGYQVGSEVEESFFQNIEERPDINILLGSRIFAEGWDTNRPNVINFINIGISDDAKKYVLQSIGRGIRIEPLHNQRKRFDRLVTDYSDADLEKIQRSNKMLESLFIFATDKEVVRNILQGLEKQSTGSEWIKVGGIQKNAKIKENELPIFIPVFKDGGFSERPFWIGNNEYDEVIALVRKCGPKVLLLKNGIKLKTYNKVINKDHFALGAQRRKKSVENVLAVADNYFNKSTRVLDEIKILDGEILHYQEVKTNIDKEEVEKLERDIVKIVKPRLTEEAIDTLLTQKTISLEEYKKKIKELAMKDSFEVLDKYLDYKTLEEHYYSPILFKQNTDRFQHVINVESEIVFLNRLQEYSAVADNKLKKCEWWYFSKIDPIDMVGIPYFDTEQSGYRTFYPDFIFWLKQDNKYYLKFIDPKGIHPATNSAEKIDGFNDFVADFNKLKNKKLERVELYFYNDQQPGAEVKEEYRKYWTNDFERIFSCL